MNLDLKQIIIWLDEQQTNRKPLTFVLEARFIFIIHRKRIRKFRQASTQTFYTDPKKLRMLLSPIRPINRTMDINRTHLYPPNPRTLTKSKSTPLLRSEKNIYRTSKLTTLDKDSRRQRVVSATVDNTPTHTRKTSRTQLKNDESLWIILSTPSSLTSGESIPLTLTLKHFYPPKNKTEGMPIFAALRIMKFSINLVEIRNRSSQGLIGFHKSTQKIMNVSAYGVDDAPTLALDKQLDLSTVFKNEMKMPEKITVPFPKTKKGVTHYLQVHATVEYFGKMFSAEWVDIPISVVPVTKDVPLFVPEEERYAALRTAMDMGGMLSPEEFFEDEEIVALS